eukprot:TRINITY_DN16_c0_g1_i1.p1 TRINITY_DN16_c0_g1~~TRINITY_DN16_c0_g1_i1.p1  ORF type:complete len:235 (+),score=56.84 TRINITY_DN16_c0_g1_i1:53-757(+)
MDTTSPKSYHSPPQPFQIQQSQSQDMSLLLRPSVEGEHRLQNTWTLWHLRKVQGTRVSENYEKSIKPIGAFSTVEGFWNYYNHLIRPNELPLTSDYHLFKYNIKPLWEDDANRKGGKWIIRLRKGLASKYWEDLMLAMIGEQFGVGDEICGAVLSIRFNEDIVSIWNRTATDQESKLKIQERLNIIFDQDPITTTLEYKEHDTSIKDLSSFRNTEQVSSPFLYQRQQRVEQRTL